MPTTSNLALPYPAPTDAPDGPGAFYALAARLDGILGGGACNVSISNGASIGNNGGSDGSYLQIGKHIFARGRLIFGSSASWGTPGAATIRDLPLVSPMDQRWSTGYGRFVPAGGNGIPVQFTPHPNSTDMWINPVMGSPAGSATTLGNAYQMSGPPPQGSILFFSLDIVLT